MTAAIGDPDTLLLGAGVLGAVGMGTAILARRRLPTGVGEGLFIAALSVFLLVNYTATGHPLDADRLLRIAACLTAVSLLWFVVTSWIERDATRMGLPPADPQVTRRRLGFGAATVSGLAAVAVVIGSGRVGADIPIWQPVILLAGLLIVTAGVWRRSRSATAGYAALALLLVSLQLLWPPAWIVGGPTAFSAILLAGGAIALGVALATVLIHWRRRARLWVDDPDQLLNPAPRHPKLLGTALGLVGLVGIAAVLVPHAALTPLALELAALAALTIGHQWRSNAVGEWGLALAAAGLVSMAGAWLPTAAACELLGWALAAAWMLWLSRFWHQQLDDGRPWTTAGRLIPAARRLGHVATAGVFVWSVVWTTTTDLGAAPAMLLDALILAGLTSLLVRDARTHRDGPAALVAGLAGLAGGALVIVLYHVSQRLGFPIAWPLVIAIVGVLFALRIGAAPPSDPAEGVFNALIGGVLPVAVVTGGLMAYAWHQSLTPTAIAGVGTLLAFILRFAGRRVVGASAPA